MLEKQNEAQKQLRQRKRECDPAETRTELAKGKTFVDIRTSRRDKYYETDTQRFILRPGRLSGRLCPSCLKRWSTLRLTGKAESVCAYRVRSLNLREV